MPYYPGDPTYGIRLTHSAAETLVNNTAKVLSFDTEITKRRITHSNVTNNNRITFDTAGFYVFGAQCSVTGETDYTSIFLQIRDNGSTGIASARLIAAGTFSADQPFLTCTGGKEFVVNDFIDVTVTQENTSANSEATVVNSQVSPIFWAARIGALN